MPHVHRTAAAQAKRKSVKNLNDTLIGCPPCLVTPRIILRVAGFLADFCLRFNELVWLMKNTPFFCCIPSVCSAIFAHSLSRGLLARRSKISAADVCQG